MSLRLPNRIEANLFMDNDTLLYTIECVLCDDDDEDNGGGVLVCDILHRPTTMATIKPLVSVFACVFLCNFLNRCFGIAYSTNM